MYKIIGFLAPLFFLVSCKRNEEQTYVSDPARPQVRVSGLLDAVMQRTPFGIKESRVDVDFLVKQEAGAYRKVTLGMEGVPAGLRYAFSTDTGVPDFPDTVSFLNGGISSGDYQPTLLLTPEGGDAQRYPIRLKVTGDTVCSTYFLNKRWTAKSKCNYVESPPYTVQIKRLGNTDTLQVFNFDNNGDTLKIWVDCRQIRVIVPPQTIGGKQVDGQGNPFRTEYPTTTIYGGTFPNGLGIGVKEVGRFNFECDYTYQMQ